MGRFKELLAQDQPLILHGALGTELEFRDLDVSGALWSARYLLEQPEAIQTIHEDYVLAGSDIITTSTYQATLEGLGDYGLSEPEAEAVIRQTVQLAKAAREVAWRQLSATEQAKRPYPLISGDVGPYAAYLANGAEYNGQYGDISKAELQDFHRRRIQLLLEEGAEMLALETLPNLLEIEALLELLETEFPEVEAYMSFTTQDGLNLSDGTPITEVAQLVEQSQQVLALGVNCSKPAHVSAFLDQIRQRTQKPLVTYPNSGEVYDGATQTWHEEADRSQSLAEQTRHWQAQGAKILGGCCRTRPSDIAALAAQIKA